MDEHHFTSDNADHQRVDSLASEERASFLAMVEVRPMHETNVIYRLGIEARFSWMISVILDRMGAAGVLVDRKSTYPYVNTDRIEALCREASIPLPDAIEAMDEEALLDTLHRLEERTLQTRKAIALLHKLRHAQSA